ncbi:hypothetical protein ERO13_A07G074800v2 [Gossypium hirsutum]|uniref:Zinc finger CCCH domain-containing protein 14 n=2 Tax=Gossypium TaxID=3633 RepID=A0A1U8IVZ8_GOSHI|nr:zinc finger CCCH domain-containing protein 14 [Gossypium hirsutum]KAB2073447.1 hypothetical protein ES319_A07G082300v1 [Gossypium barbadense]KAG4191168.1 hypothetical protein ERO13_A07G074800v2 [Gossypium hirsutum]
MEKLTSPSSNKTTTTTIANYVSPPLSPPLEDLTSDFSTMYDFIFSSTLPESLSITPSTCSSSSDDLKQLVPGDVSTEDRLNQARLILEYQQLCDHFDLCVSRLQALKGEVEKLRRENNDLRVANIELIKLLSQSSQAAMINRNLHWEKVADLNEKRWERGLKKSLPKSLSFNSCNHMQRVVNPPPPRVHVAPVTRREEKGIEMEVYNQGMVKTELCNKWQQTGTCPYADHCQFAHGITELRPVIRHPRYKTQVCRMILAGEACPYGHRCHFRHSLTEQEELLISP